MQIVLLICLTSMGVTALIGIIVLNLNNAPTLGSLPSVATGALVALTGLVVVIGQATRQGRMERKLDTIHDNTNGGLYELQQKLNTALQTIQVMEVKSRPPSP